MPNEGDTMDELSLDLSRHCVETAIKKRYNRAISDYFQATTERDRHEKIIDLTQQALHALDFNRLRNQYAPLAGHTDAHVVLSRKADRLSIHIDGHPVEL